VVAGTVGAPRTFTKPTLLVALGVHSSSRPLFHNGKFEMGHLFICYPFRLDLLIVDFELPDSGPCKPIHSFLISSGPTGFTTFPDSLSSFILLFVHGLSFIWMRPSLLSAYACFKAFLPLSLSLSTSKPFSSLYVNNFWSFIPLCQIATRPSLSAFGTPKSDLPCAWFRLNIRIICRSHPVCTPNAGRRDGVPIDRRTLSVLTLSELVKREIIYPAVDKLTSATTSHMHMTCNWRSSTFLERRSDDRAISQGGCSVSCYG